MIRELRQGPLSGRGGSSGGFIAAAMDCRVVLARRLRVSQRVIRSTLVRVVGTTKTRVDQIAMNHAVALCHSAILQIAPQQICESVMGSRQTPRAGKDTRGRRRAGQTQ